MPAHFTNWIAACSGCTVYDTTAAELRLSARKVAADGLIAGHDYTRGNWETYHRYGVVEAVNEFCVREGWAFAAITHEPQRDVSFVLRRLPATPPAGP